MIRRRTRTSSQQTKPDVTVPIMLRSCTTCKGKQWLVFARRMQLRQNHGLKSHSLQPLGDKPMREEDKSLRAVGCLPIKLQRELSFTSVADRVVYRSKRVARGIVQEIRVTNTCPKVGVIQEVEELGPELQVGVFSRSEFLEDREIKVGVSGPVDLIPGSSEGAEISLPNGCHGRRLNEG